MPSTSDVYMELSDPSVWGETYDDQFGMGAKGRQLGAFEVSSFNFSVTDSSSDTADSATVTGGASTGRQATGGRVATGVQQTAKQTFSISKYIDKASPDLFLACCTKSPIAWGIVSVRETGEHRRRPYLVVEFQRLHVTSFKWEDLPGDADSASKLETIDFSYETVLIKYSRQDLSGEHRVVKMKAWDFSDHPTAVSELDAGLQASASDD